jgi:hypothetical protein
VNDNQYLTIPDTEAVDAALTVLLDDVPVTHHSMFPRQGVRDALATAQPSLILPVLKRILGDSTTIEEAVLSGAPGVPIGEYVSALEGIVRRLAGAIQEVADAREDHLPDAGAFTHRAPAAWTERTQTEPGVTNIAQGNFPKGLFQVGQIHGGVKF